MFQKKKYLKIKHTTSTRSAFLNTRKRAVNVASVARLALVGANARTATSRDKVVAFSERRFWRQHHCNAVALQHNALSVPRV